MVRESEAAVAMVLANQGSDVHFATGRGGTLCGLLRDVNTTASVTQTTCVGCLRILVTNGKDAEAILRNKEAKRK